MEGIAGYEFIRPLGPGNHGAFYLARKPERLPVAADYVAVKVFENTGQDAFRRATRELQAFSAVQSPYLATLYDAGQQSGLFYYSMEYLPNGSLRDPVTPLGRSGTCVAVAHAARAAQALHDAGMVHRDIRPGNVLLADPGGKLSDLGLAKATSPDSAVTGMSAVSSVEFTDPAQLAGEEPNPAGDVWSLGATLHRTLAGAGLYGELPTHDPLLALRTVYSTTPKVSAAVGQDVADMVRACIGEPAGRPTASQLAERLEALARG